MYHKRNQDHQEFKWRRSIMQQMEEIKFWESNEVFKYGEDFDYQNFGNQIHEVYAKEDGVQPSVSFQSIFQQLMT